MNKIEKKKTKKKAKPLPQVTTVESGKQVQVITFNCHFPFMSAKACESAWTIAQRLVWTHTNGILMLLMFGKVKCQWERFGHLLSVSVLTKGDPLNTLKQFDHFRMPWPEFYVKFRSWHDRQNLTHCLEKYYHNYDLLYIFFVIAG